MLDRGKPPLFEGTKNFAVASMRCPQEIIETCSLGYPSNLDDYPRNGKTTVMFEDINKKGYH